MYVTLDQLLNQTTSGWPAEVQRTCFQCCHKVKNHCWDVNNTCISIIITMAVITVVTGWWSWSPRFTSGTMRTRVLSLCQSLTGNCNARQMGKSSGRWRLNIVIYDENWAINCQCHIKILIYTSKDTTNDIFINQAGEHVASKGTAFLPMERAIFHFDQVQNLNRYMQKIIPVLKMHEIWLNISQIVKQGLKDWTLGSIFAIVWICII